jgi:endonuclease/exonuclease/phosphatase family metal-dependent hydrolase
LSKGELFTGVCLEIKAAKARGAAILNRQRNSPLFFLTILVFFFALPVFGQNEGNPGTTVRVLTYNIHHAVSLSGTNSLDQIADLINQTNPDFVALQECDFNTKRSGFIDQVKEFACKTKMIPLFGRAMTYDEGEYGDGILSKTTFLSSQNLALPYTDGYEPRSAIAITTVIKTGDTVQFICTHLDYLKNDSVRLLQAQEIIRTLGRGRYPSILAGDLNDIPGSSTLNLLQNHWFPTYRKELPEPTFPADGPRKKIDYIMYSPKTRWSILSAEVISNNGASDHCACLVTLVLHR